MAVKSPPNQQEALRKRATVLGATMLTLLEAEARAGDVAAMKAILNKTLPDIKPVSACVLFDLPEGDLTEQACAVLKAVAAGKLPPDIGASLIASLAQIARITEISEFDRRLQALEAGGQP